MTPINIINRKFKEKFDWQRAFVRQHMILTRPDNREDENIPLEPVNRRQEQPNIVAIPSGLLDPGRNVPSELHYLGEREDNQYFLMHMERRQNHQPLLIFSSPAGIIYL